MIRFLAKIKNDAGDDKVRAYFICLPFRVSRRDFGGGRTADRVANRLDNRRYVGARSAAMSFNRIIDRDFDAENPRTANRELPSGKLSVSFAWMFFASLSACFCSPHTT
jgi:hypothetical protein